MFRKSNLFRFLLICILLKVGDHFLSSYLSFNLVYCLQCLDLIPLWEWSGNMIIVKDIKKEIMHSLLVIIIIC